MSGNRTKICHITTVHPPDDDRIYFKECRSFLKYGYDISIIAQSDHDFVQDGIRIISLPITKSRLKRVFLLSFRALILGLKQKADLYHFHDPELILIGLALKLFGKRVLYDVHEDVPEQILDKSYLSPFLKHLIATVFDKIEKCAVAYFDYVITATEPIKNKFIGRSNNVIAIKNYVVREYVEQHKVKRVKDNQVCAIIFIGAIYDKRGLTECVCALNDLGRTDVILQMYGPADQGYLNELVKLDTHRVVDYKGCVPYSQISEKLMAADIGYVCDYPLKRNIEGLPVKLFEYMVAKLPVVASDFAPWKRIVENDECGICVNPLSVEEIKTAFNLLINDKVLRAKMGDNGYRAVSEKYCWESEEEKLINVYRNVLYTKSRKVTYV